MWIPYRCWVLLLVLNIVQNSCVKSSLTLRSATDVTLNARGRMCYIILIFSSWCTNLTTLLVCACILMCLCVLWVCVINLCLFFQKNLLRVCWMSTKEFSFVKLHNLNFHILLAFITQLTVLWVIIVHRMNLCSALGDYTWRLLGLWVWENYTTWVHCK